MSRSDVVEKRAPLTIHIDAGSAPEGGWIFWRRINFCFCLELNQDSWVVQPTA